MRLRLHLADQCFSRVLSQIHSVRIWRFEVRPEKTRTLEGERPLDEGKTLNLSTRAFLLHEFLLRALGLAP